MRSPDGPQKGVIKLPQREFMNHNIDTNAQVVYLVDDRPSDLKLIERVCENVGIKTKVYDSARRFLAQIDSVTSGCLIADMLMPEMSGLELFSEIRTRSIQITTILMTGFADATTCRAAFQAGVFDFVDKEISPDALLTIIRQGLYQNTEEVRLHRVRNQRRVRIDSLTHRELDVAKLLSRGRALKEVGSKLQISVQTASKHRSNIFDKLEVSNEVELHQIFTDCINMIDSVK